MPKFKAVIIDLDGTLIEFKLNYMPLRTEAMNLLIHKGLPSNLFSIRDTMFEMLTKATTYLSDKGVGKDKLHEIYDAVFALADPYEMDAVSSANLIPGAEEALRSLKSMGLQLGLFTTDGIKATRHALSKFGLDTFFDVVVTRETVRKVKPDCAQLIAATTPLDVTPEEVVVIGDSIVDIKCAKAVRALAVGVLTGLTKLEDLKKSGADYVIPSISELPILIRKIQGP